MEMKTALEISVLDVLESLKQLTIVNQLFLCTGAHTTGY